MNRDQLEGNWKQFKGKAQQKWGKLTEDDWDVVEGKHDELMGMVGHYAKLVKNQERAG